MHEGPLQDSDVIQVKAKSAAASGPSLLKCRGACLYNTLISSGAVLGRPARHDHNMISGLTCFLAVLGFFHVSEFALAWVYMRQDLSPRCKYSVVPCKPCELLVAAWMTLACRHHSHQVY